MEQFLAERYLPPTDLERETALLRELVAGADMRLLQTVYLPEDELCFFLIEGDSAATVAQLATFDRIAPAVMR